MKLKTYTAETMAQALAQVRKDLGKDAMILHTRSFRVGSWFGFGGKMMVEITASSSSTAHARAKTPRAMPRVVRQQVPAQTIETKPVKYPVARSNQQFAEQLTSSLQQREPEMVIQRGRTVTRQRLGSPIVDEPTDGGFIPNRRTPADTRGLQGRDALFGDDSSALETPPNKKMPTSRLNDQLPISVTIPKNAPTIPTPGPASSKKRVAQEPVSRVQRASSRTNSPIVVPTIDPTTGQTELNTDTQTNAQLRSQLDTLSKMMGQVLESTRKTAVAVGTGNSAAALPNGEMPAPLFALYAKMMDNDVPVDLADKLVGSVRDRLDAVELKDPLVVRQALLRAIELTIETREESALSLGQASSTGRPWVIALVGPTGVGKTTTVAKLAATYKLRHGKSVGLITSDTYRIAAVEQLRTYAGIIGLPLKIANSPEELAQAIEDLGECDVVVIDTAGRSQNNTRRLEELAEFTAAANPDETHLVLSTTVGDNVLRKTAQSFKALGPDRCILTKLDEAVTTGPIAGLSDRIGLPLSFITVGQEVPDDLECARADRLARCVLDGPEAVVRRWSEDNG